jgi:ankyrin repeat protein
MIAAAHDNGPMIVLLIQSGADVAKKSNEGQTALDIARENGNEAAVNTLSMAADKAGLN